MIKLYHGDCLEVMDELIKQGVKVDMILTDPPYGTINGLGDGEIAKQERYRECKWDIAIEPKLIYERADCLLSQNGKLILFSQEPYTARLIYEQTATIPFCYRAIWKKNVFGNKFMCNKAMVNYFEDIVIFSKLSKKYDYDGNNPLREYFKNVLDFIGLKSCKQVNEKLGHRKAEHTFYVTGKNTGSTQFLLCTEKTYNELISVFYIDNMQGFKPYNELKEINQNYYNGYCQNDWKPSTFNLWQGNKSKSNILEYAKDNNGFHPTQKPVALLEDLINTYTNKNDVVLDFTMGSGSTGVACKNTTRNFIGIELDKGYFDISEKRINETSQQFSLFNHT